MNTLIDNFKTTREQASVLEFELYPFKEKFHRFLRENDPAGRADYKIFGWSDSMKPTKHRFALPSEEYTLNLSISTEEAIAFVAMDEDEELHFMIPVEYLEDANWENKILAEMESDENLVRNELIEMAGFDEASKVHIHTELYAVRGPANPAFDEIFRVSYGKTSPISTLWLGELVTRYRFAENSAHFYSRISHGLYSHLPYHLIERGYSSEWEKYRTLTPKQRHEKLKTLMEE
ncbi:MAG: hypothetical protein H9W81_10105 [Enterococcus sp.]|nr:hypothetical protein [Enterococcus sp.]